MIPQSGGQANFSLKAPPDRTPRLDRETCRLRGTAEGLAAVEQAVYFILHTERYAWLIHSWDYGVELRDLMGKDTAYCIPEIERRVREALLQDDRVTAVDSFSFTVEKHRVLARFRVVSARGSFQSELGVNV